MANKKRPLDEADNSSSDAKRARLTQGAAAGTGAGDANAEQTEKPERQVGRDAPITSVMAAHNEEELVQAVLKHPKPIFHKRLYASFLEDVADEVYTGLNPSSVDTLVSEWLESVDSDRVKHCHSDTHVCPFDNPFKDDGLSRRHTKSAPGMLRESEVDSLVMPPTPSSVPISLASVDRIHTATISGRSSQTSETDPVETRWYRWDSLAENKVVLRKKHEEFPDEIADLIREISKNRSSPEPSPDEVLRDERLDALETKGLDEAMVEHYFLDKVLPHPESWNGLQQSLRLQMNVDYLPISNTTFRLSTPNPDVLYGYELDELSRHQAQLRSMNCQPRANNVGLAYPFLVVEFKGFKGELFTATNQCIGACVSSINMIERLKQRLPKSEKATPTTIDNVVFAAAVNATEARLFIMWREDRGGILYFMQKFGHFLVQKPKDYIEFRRLIRNITEWGLNKRLNHIHSLLDVIEEQDRQTASKRAKSRMPPFDQVAETGSVKKLKREATKASVSPIPSIEVEESESGPSV